MAPINTAAADESNDRSGGRRPNETHEYIGKDEVVTEQKILTKHPLGKKGQNVSKEKYDAIRGAMLSVLGGRELTHTELMNALTDRLKGKFAGNVSWYGETVKLDLEARKVVERTGARPERYRLK